jgi:transposase
MNTIVRIDTWMLASQACDMRSGMDSLLGRVVAVFGSAQPHVAYVFANARATRLKVLVHDGWGLWLCTRRLHQGIFAWPRGAQTHIELSPQQWSALTVGLPWQRLNMPLDTL